jgi:glycosyltransferase involved in cell wall biosynthesis
MGTLALCIPAFNASDTLPRLLTSATQQLIPFDEIYVYNDCSTDDTAIIAKKFGAQVIEGDVNCGCAVGKNKLAGVAKSSWLHFHDADDDLLPNFTSVAHKWIDRDVVPDVLLLHYRYEDFLTHELMGESDYQIEKLKEDVVKFSIENKLVNFAIIRKSSFLEIGGFDTDPKVLYNEDRAFYTRAAIKGLTFDYEPELTCINYYYRSSMSSGNKAKCARATLNVWNIVYDSTGKKYYKEIAEQLLNNATYAATANDWKTVNQSVKKAREIFPGGIPEGSGFFRMLYKILPYKAFFIREIVIKYLTSKRAK